MWVGLVWPLTSSQLFVCVPSSQSRMLVLEHDLLKVILTTLLELLAPCVSNGKTLKLNSSNYKHNRVFYIMHDLRWVWLHCHVTYGVY